MTIIAGVDPGLSGAVAVLDRRALRSLHDMPTFTITRNGRKRRELDTQQLVELLDCGADLVVVERVNAMPGQGVASVFTFGQGFGEVRGILAALKAPVIYVPPRTWKKQYGLTSDKDASRKMASQLLPAHAARWSRKRDDGRAEAVLLALYGYTAAPDINEVEG